MSLDVYTHVMPPDEITADKFLPLLSGGARIERWPTCSEAVLATAPISRIR